MNGIIYIFLMDLYTSNANILNAITGAINFGETCDSSETETRNTLRSLHKCSTPYLNREIGYGQPPTLKSQFQFSRFSDFSDIVLPETSDKFSNELPGSQDDVRPHREAQIEIPVEYEIVAEMYEVINMMYDMHRERETTLQDSVDGVIKKLALEDEFFSIPNLSKKLENIRNVLSHIINISKKVDKLKVLMRDNHLNDFWKIHVAYHRNVVNFFNLTRQIMKDVSEDIDCIEKSKLYDPEVSRNLLFLERRLVADLRKNSDDITEFRNHLQLAQSQH